MHEDCHIKYELLTVIPRQEYQTNYQWLLEVFDCPEHVINNLDQESFESFCQSDENAEADQHENIE